MQPEPPRDENTMQVPPQQLTEAPYASTQETPSPTAPPVVTMHTDSTESPEMSPVPSNQAVPATPKDEPVHWQAQEYVHHEKNTLWFVVFGAITVLLMAVAIFLMNAITFAILIPVMAAALLVYAHRPPRIIEYTLSRQGLHVNDRLYSFAEFKGFGVIHDGEEYSIMLIPVKRFHQGIMVYFPEEAGEAIVDMLGVRLPMQELHLDFLDRIVRKLRI